MANWPGMRPVALLLGLALAFGACGDDTENGSADDAPVPAGEPVTSGPQPEGEAALVGLPRVEERVTVDDPRTTRIIGTSDMSIEQYLEFVVKDVWNFWAEEFARYKPPQQLPPVSYWIVNGENQPASVTAGCGRGSFYSDGTDGAELIGPFYCPLNERTIYLPAGWLFDNAYGIQGREFAVGYVVAHEVSHHVQEVLGILPRQRAGEFLVKQTELQADCLAGVWARTIGNRNLLEGNDVDEAISLAGELGNPPGTPLEKDHGTDAERTAAFSNGFNTGQGGSCSY